MLGHDGPCTQRFIERFERVKGIAHEPRAYARETKELAGRAQRDESFAMRLRSNRLGRHRIGERYVDDQRAAAFAQRFMPLQQRRGARMFGRRIVPD